MSVDKVKKLKLGDINPHIRVIRMSSIPKEFKSGLRYNLHYQFHYILNGIGHFYINGTEYTAKKGDLCIWSPGQIHSISTSENSSMVAIGVQFDFTRNYVDKVYLPISYSKDDFNPDLIHEIVKFTDFSGFQPFVTLRNDSLAEHLLKSAMGLYINGGKYRYEKASLKLKEFFILLAEEISVQNSPKEQLKNISELLEYLENHYFEDVSNFKLAAQFGYHPVYFNRILHEEVGMSLHQYIINLRITEAIHLLQHSSLPICQIAEKVGYSNAQYFSRIFKYKTGYNPSYLRK